MDKIFLYDTKTLKSQINTKIFVGDNLITKIKILIPDNIGGYPKRECEFNLRAIISEGNLSYIINPNEPYFYITNDITEKAQTVKLMMIITHAGNVIGRTNTVDLIVNEPAEAPDPPLTPREEFDEVIAEQRAEIAEQAETINSQASQIEQDSETISGLNSQVSELSTENETLQTQHTADQSTIQYLINNPPEVRLQSKSVNPTSQMQTVEPDSGYGGLSSVTVGAVTPPRLQGKAVSPTNLMQNVQPDNGYDGLSNVSVAAVTAQELGFDYADLKEGVEFLGGVGTYNPLPEGSEGGIYFDNYDDSGFPTTLIYYNYYTGSNDAISFPSHDMRSFKSHIKEIIFRNCPQITNYPSGQELYYYANVEKYIFPENTQTINTFFYESNYVLKTVWLPNTLTSLSAYPNLFENCINLEFVILENGFNCNNLNLSSSTRFTAETIVSCLEALADRTGQTAYTITFGTKTLTSLQPSRKQLQQIKIGI